MVCPVVPRSVMRLLTPVFPMGMEATVGVVLRSVERVKQHIRTRRAEAPGGPDRAAGAARARAVLAVGEDHSGDVRRGQAIGGGERQLVTPRERGRLIVRKEAHARIVIEEQFHRAGHIL